MVFTNAFREKGRSATPSVFETGCLERGFAVPGRRTPLEAQFYSFPHILELTWPPQITRWHFLSDTADLRLAAFGGSIHSASYLNCSWPFYSKFSNSTKKASITYKVLSFTGLFVLGHSRSSKKASPPLEAKSGDGLEPMKCTLTLSLKGTGMH